MYQKKPFHMSYTYKKYFINLLKDPYVQDLIQDPPPLLHSIAVPLHVMEALARRGGIAPTHS
jgi:hypothetical protein